MKTSLSYFLLALVCTGLLSCNTLSSDAGASFDQITKDSFLKLSTDQVWKSYKELFKQGTSWNKVIKLNDMSMSLKYQISSFDSNKDAYVIKVTSNKGDKDYRQDRDSFLMDLSTIVSFSKTQDCKVERGTLEVSKHKYDVIELSSKDLSLDDVTPIFPDVDGLKNQVDRASVKMWVLAKEAVVLKTQITFNGKKDHSKVIEFSMNYEELKFK